MKKLISLLLASLLLISALAGCATDTPAPADDTTVSDTTTAAPDTTTAEVTTEAPIVAEIPANVKYDGYQFRILCNNKANTHQSYDFEIEEEQTGDVMDDAVYKRNQMILETLGVTIKRLASANNLKDFQNSVTAGGQDYDMLSGTQTQILQNGATYGAEISTLPYIDLEKPWWDERVIKGASIANKTVGLCGDINLVDDGATWCVYVNKDFAKSHNINVNDMYQLVRDGKWTLDRFLSYNTDSSRDVNGDGVQNHLDEWGYVGSGTSSVAMLWSMGGSYSTLDKDGKVVFNVDNEKNMTILNKLYDILADKTKVITAARCLNDSGKTDFNIQRAIFIEGRALFLAAIVSYAPVYLRAMEDDYGVLPNPKWDDAQKDYIATTQEWIASMWMAPRNAENLERTSVILEYMGYVSHDTTKIAYYDEILALKGVRDEASTEMLKLVLDARTIYDPGQALACGKVRTISTWVEAASNNLASEIAANKAAMQAKADDYFEKYAALGK